MIIPLKTFAGEFPRLQPHELPEGGAQEAVAADLARGGLSGLRSRRMMPGINSGFEIRSIYIHDTAPYAWFAWRRDVDAVRSPVVGEQFNRFYWTDDATSRAMYVSRGDVGAGYEPSPSNIYKVGVPQPAAPAAADPVGGFVIARITGYEFTTFCEMADGSRINSQIIVPTGDTNATAPLISSRAWTFVAANACGVVSGGTGGTSSAATSITPAEMGFVANYQHEVSMEAIYSLPNARLYRDATGQDEGARYFYWSDWAVIPLPDQVYVAILEGGSDALGNPGATTFSGRGYFRIGAQGWYCTDPTKAPPTVSETATSAGATTTAQDIKGPAVEVAMTREDGAVLKAIVREGTGTEWPTELPGFTAGMEFSGGTLTLTIRGKSDSTEARAYTYTYVNIYGEESAPADPLVLDVVQGQVVELTYTPPPAVGVPYFGYAPVTLVRIYRTATGTSGTQYLYVGEVAINDTSPTFIDDVRTDSLGETLQTVDYLPPELDLVGLVALPNGSLAAFRGNEVHFSVPYLPYAWRRRDIQTLPHNVVGVVAYENSVYVTTTAAPYIISGVEPEHMTQIKVPAIQAGVSKWSIVSAGGYVVYASNDGLVMARGLDASLEASLRFFTREKWRDLYGPRLSLMRLAIHDGAVVVFFGDGTPGFMLKLDEASGTMTRLIEPMFASFVHPETDALYASQGYRVFEFRGEMDDSSRQAWSWMSKEFIAPRPINFGAMQLVGDGAVSVEVFADGVSRHLETVSLDGNGRACIRLPGGFLARRWAVKFCGEGLDWLKEATLASTMTELRNV